MAKVGIILEEKNNNEEYNLDNIEQNNITIFNINYKKKRNKIIISTFSYSLLLCTLEKYEFKNNKYNREKILRIVNNQEEELDNKIEELYKNLLSSTGYSSIIGAIPAFIDGMFFTKIFTIVYMSYLICNLARYIKLKIKYGVNGVPPIDSIRKIVEDSDKEEIEEKEKKIECERQKLGFPGEIYTEVRELSLDKKMKEKIKGTI